MIAIIVDDEYWALDDLRAMVEELPEVEAVRAFSDSDDALAWAEEHRFDLAFLDIHMRGMDGLRLAEKLRQVNPHCFLIFCTGYGDYRPEAFMLHANGYLCKPIQPEMLRREMDFIRSWTRQDELLSVQCYGGFEAYGRDGKPLEFHRSLAKELLAVLVYRRGISMTSKELCTYLWNDDGQRDQRNLDYLRKLFADLNAALRQAGAEEVLQKTGLGHSIDVNKIRFLKPADENAEYFAGYTWI